MTLRKVVNGDLRAYINWDGRWRHVYIVSSYDQLTIMGDAVRMLEFRLSKRTRLSYSAEKSKFHQKKPAIRSGKRGVEA